jgi:hypothetical protein
VRIVGRIDHVEPEAGSAQEFERSIKVLPDELDRDRGQPFLAGFFAGAFFADGFAGAFASGALRPAPSFTGLAGLGLAEAFATGPLAGASATSFSSVSACALPLAGTYFAFGLTAWP